MIKTIQMNSKYLGFHVSTEYNIECNVSTEYNTECNRDLLSVTLNGEYRSCLDQ